MTTISTNNAYPYLKNSFFKICSTILFFTWIYFYYSALDGTDWWMENILVILFFGLLLMRQNKFAFSNPALAFIFVYLILHLYGARMAYTHDELGEYLKTQFHLLRNPYDRIVHFSFGFLLMYPLGEYLTYKFKLKGTYLFLLVHTIILALAAAFELIEWGVASFTDSATGETYVATQGDPWDAQKDIILALIGSIIFGGLLKLFESLGGLKKISMVK
jgi:putative membrane protein